MLQAKITIIENKQRIKKSPRNIIYTDTHTRHSKSDLPILKVPLSTWYNNFNWSQILTQDKQKV